MTQTLVKWQSLPHTVLYQRWVLAYDTKLQYICCDISFSRCLSEHFLHFFLKSNHFPWLIKHHNNTLEYRPTSSRLWIRVPSTELDCETDVGHWRKAVLMHERKGFTRRMLHLPTPGWFYNSKHTTQTNTRQYMQHIALFATALRKNMTRNKKICKHAANTTPCFIHQTLL